VAGERGTEAHQRTRPTERLKPSRLALESLDRIRTVAANDPLPAMLLVDVERVAPRRATPDEDTGLWPEPLVEDSHISYSSKPGRMWTFM
jgi:hypothetical protein